MCEGIGGTWVTTGKCVAYGRQFKGQDANGTPLAIGTKGYGASTGAGFCYASMRTGIAVAALPCRPSNEAPSTRLRLCLVSSDLIASMLMVLPALLMRHLPRQTARPMRAGDVHRSDHTSPPGECLANGGFMGQLDTTKRHMLLQLAPLPRRHSTSPGRLSNADEGCLHCHSYLTRANGPAER